MFIEKLPENKLKLIPEGEDSIDDIVYSPELFWNDMLFRTCSGGWHYFHDQSTNIVYELDNYGYNHLDDLIAQKKVILHGEPLKDTEIEFEE